MKVCHDCKKKHPNYFFCACKDYTERGMNICKTCERERRYKCSAEHQAYLLKRKEQAEKRKKEWEELLRYRTCQRCEVRGLKEDYVSCIVDPKSIWAHRSWYCKKCGKEKKDEYLEVKKAKAALRSFKITTKTFGWRQSYKYKELLESEMLRLETNRIINQKNKQT